IRNLKGKPPVSDLFGVRGRRWLAAQELPPDEQETVAACLRQIAFLDAEIALVERALAEQVLDSEEMRRLLTLPGVNFVTPGPLRAFHEPIAVRRGGNIATVAVARKLTVIAWHMLSRGEDYAFARPSLTREKIRRLELMTGAEHQKGKRIGVFATREQHQLDKELAAQAELAYRRLVQDWQPAINKGTRDPP